MTRFTFVRFAFAQIRFLGLKVGETCTLCCDYDDSSDATIARGYDLRYREAFFDGLSKFGRVLVTLGICQLVLMDTCDSDGGVYFSRVSPRYRG